MSRESGAGTAEPEDEGLMLPPGMVTGRSPLLRQVFKTVRRVAPSDLPVLLLGPTGVGKELFARLIHNSSPRRESPFVPLLTTALPVTLIEAELFGIERGVATGVEARPGLAVRAQGGTLFLDEIGDLAPELQGKLLRMLQEKEVWPVGARRPVPIDVRIVAATHRDLKSLVLEGAFREDLYFRLAGLCLSIPPLAERPEDIPELAIAFLAESAGDKHLPGFSTGALELLRTREWRGNVRELRTAVQRAAVMARDGEILDSRSFMDLAPRVVSAGPTVPLETPVEGEDSLQQRLDSVERQALREALARHGGNRSRAARELGLSRQGFRNKLRRHGIDPRRFESDR